MFILRQSTAVDVLIGPFVDGTDGVSVEEALSPSVQLSKNGQTAATKNEATTPALDNAGYYNCIFDATDTGTVGTLVAFVEGTTATHLAVRHEFQIMDTAAFDALFADGAEGPLQATTVGNTLDVSAGGEAGLDWNNIGSPTTAQNLSGTNIDVDQVVASVSGNVGGSVATLTTLPSIPANWITLTGITDGAFTAAKFAAASLNGKGDWNINKTGYSLTTADWNVGKTGYDLNADQSAVTVGAITNHTAQTGDTYALANGAQGFVAIDDVVDNLNLGIIYGIAETGTLSVTQATTDLAGYVNSELVGRVIIFTSGTADGQASNITAYASASGLVTFDAITTLPANLDTFKIV